MITDEATEVPPGGFVVLVDDPEAFAEVFPEVEGTVVSNWPALNNGGDTPTLRFGDTVIDAVPYASSWGGGDDRSLERIDPGGPSTAAVNFGSATATAGGTPGTQNSIFEIDTTPPVLQFAEQVSDTTIVAFASEPLDPATVVPAAFSLGNAPARTATLADPTTLRLGFASIEPGTLSAEGLGDLSGNVQPETSAPLAVQPAPGDLVVNEIMFDPLADDSDNQPNQPEYIELANLSGKSLTLRNLLFTDRAGETGAADTTRIGQRATLSPNGFAVLYAASDVTDPPATQSLLALSFPDVDFTSDAIALLPVDANSLGLVNGGDLIHLQRADGTTLDSVAYSPDWHTEALDDTKGTALERISATGPPDAADNWTSSTAVAGGTPGQQNAISLAPPPEQSRNALSVGPSPFSADRDGGTRIRYVLSSAPALVRARIYDARGRKVRTLEDARLAGPTGELLWNGRDDRGNRVRVGIYIVLFEAVDAEGGTVTTQKEPVVVGRSLH
jgi:hypothetical protein